MTSSFLLMVNVASLWNLWVRRQKGNEQGLIFIKAQEEDKRRPSPALVVPQEAPVLLYPVTPTRRIFSRICLMRQMIRNLILKAPLPMLNLRIQR